VFEEESSDFDNYKLGGLIGSWDKRNLYKYSLLQHQQSGLRGRVSGIKSTSDLENYKKFREFGRIPLSGKNKLRYEHTLREGKVLYDAKKARKNKRWWSLMFSRRRLKRWKAFDWTWIINDLSYDYLRRFILVDLEEPDPDEDMAMENLTDKSPVLDEYSFWRSGIKPKTWFNPLDIQGMGEIPTRGQKLGEDMKFGWKWSEGVDIFSNTFDDDSLLFELLGYNLNSKPKYSDTNSKEIYDFDLEGIENYLKAYSEFDINSYITDMEWSDEWSNDSKHYLNETNIGGWFDKLYEFDDYSNHYTDELGVDYSAKKNMNHDKTKNSIFFNLKDRKLLNAFLQNIGISSSNYVYGNMKFWDAYKNLPFLVKSKINFKILNKIVDSNFEKFDAIYEIGPSHNLKKKVGLAMVTLLKITLSTLKVQKIQI
jgi:hypothetical protein